MVEQRTENPCVAGSIPVLATFLLPENAGVANLLKSPKAGFSNCHRTSNLEKGYIKCSSDEKDKRKRYLHLTEFGKKILNAFEPIAFNQTKEALQALTPEEAELVHQGVALYAKGLKNSRLQKKALVKPGGMGKLSTAALDADNLIEIHNRLDQLGFKLRLFSQEDESSLYGIFKEVVDSGSEFPYECNSIQEFYRQFLSPKSHVYVCRSSANEVVGGFYIRSNFSGRSSHIANAAYMIKSGYRGQGIGTLLINASLKIAKNLGYDAMQFNMVLSQNTGATRLYQKLGFNIIGAIPLAIRNPDGSYQEGYILHRKLEC